MHHAAPRDLKPFLTHLAGERAAEINFETRLGVTEIMRAKTDAGVRAHQLFEDKLHGAFKVTHGHVAIYVKALDLMKGGVVRGVRIVAAIHAARDDNADGRWLRFHDADLNGGSVRAQ